MRAGRIRYIGLSNYRGWQIQKAVDLCKSRGWEEPVVLQHQYSLLSRGVEYEILEVCQDSQLGFVPWGILKGGWLAERYTRGVEPEPDSRAQGWAVCFTSTIHILILGIELGQLEHGINGMTKQLIVSNSVVDGVGQGEGGGRRARGKERRSGHAMGDSKGSGDFHLDWSQIGGAADGILGADTR